MVRFDLMRLVAFDARMRLRSKCVWLRLAAFEICMRLLRLAAFEMRVRLDATFNARLPRLGVEGKDFGPRLHISSPEGPSETPGAQATPRLGMIINVHLSIINAYK